jgi:hypothetical protein
VLKHAAEFVPFGQKRIWLDSELSLNYRDMKGYCIACINTVYDVSELEAQRFLEKLDERIEDFRTHGDTEANAGRFKSVVMQDYVGSYKDGKSRLASMNMSNDLDDLLELPSLSLITASTLKEP